MSEEAMTVASQYLTELESAYSVFPVAQVSDLADKIYRRRLVSNVFVIGNGGSATTASHMATDLGVGSLRKNNPIRSISLTDNSGVITATSNDLGYANIFSQQIKLLGKPDDFLICFSASGNSENLIHAINTAKQMNIYSVSITGFDGGVLKEMADFNIHIPTKIGSYGVVEDLHSSVSHMLTEIIRNL